MIEQATVSIGGVTMKRLTTTSAIMAAALMGSLLIADVAEAKKPRNPVERRLSPNGGFFERSTPSRSSISRQTWFSPSWKVTPSVTAPSKSVRWFSMPTNRTVYRSYDVPRRMFFR